MNCTDTERLQVLVVEAEAARPLNTDLETRWAVYTLSLSVLLWLSGLF